MNILYVSPMLINYDSPDGVARKLLFQCDALGSINDGDKMYLASFFSENYYAVKSKGFEREIKFENKGSKQLNMFQIYPQLPAICKELNINAVYFRVMALSWVTDKLFAELKKQGIKIVIEIPTYPFWKEKWLDVVDCMKNGKPLRSIKRSGTNIVYWAYAHRLKKYIEAIVTFSDIKSLWGVKVIGIANGYHFEMPENAKKLKEPSEELALLMVASVRDNHGADRVIQGLADYYRENGKRQIVFHIVGDGDAVPKLKQQTEKLENMKEHIVFHGFKSGKALDKMYEIADIGVSALGFHRLGVTYCSPLKSKEYFAKGLPIVGTTAEKDILKTKCKEYYFSVPEDDTPVNISELVDFYDELRKREKNGMDIIRAGSEYFDWKSIMKPVYRALCGK